MNNDTITSRQSKIYNYLCNKSFTAVNEISKALNITTSTVRRDLKVLEEKKRIISFHGGVSVNTGYEQYELRTLRCAEEKKRIGQKAALFVEDNDVIYIGGGSTTNEFAAALSQKADIKNVIVVASSVKAATFFLKKDNFRVLLPGGDLYSLNESMMSGKAIDFLRNFHFKKVFVGTQAVNVQFGYTNPTYELNELKKIVISLAKKVILMCDHTKIGKADPFITCGLEKIDMIVTDENSDSQELLDEMAEKGLEIIKV